MSQEVERFKPTASILPCATVEERGFSVLLAAASLHCEHRTGTGLGLGLSIACTYSDHTCFSHQPVQGRREGETRDTSITSQQQKEQAETERQSLAQG